MNRTRKVAVRLPVELLAYAQEYTGAGITETLKMALERLVRERFYSRMRELRGKAFIDDRMAELREDREFDAHGNVVN